MTLLEGLSLMFFFLQMNMLQSLYSHKFPVRFFKQLV